MKHIKSFVKTFTSPQQRALVKSFRYAKQTGILLPFLVKLIFRQPKERLGTEYGGWTIPKDQLSPGDVCYCVGCGEDISFDLSLIKLYECEVHGVDPTPRSLDFVAKETVDFPSYVMHAYALWTESGKQRFYAPKNTDFVSYSLTSKNDEQHYIDVDTIRLSDLVKDNHHQKIKILKLDIEGAESQVIATILEDNMDIDILCVEFDELHNATQSEKETVRNTVQNILLNGYKVFWVESLNFSFVKTSSVSREK